MKFLPIITPKLALTLLCTCLYASTAQAHEFWIQPSSFLVTSQDLVTVQLMHGERFAGDLVARDDPKIMRFDFSHPDQDPIALRGHHGSSTSFLRPAGSGVIVYQSELYDHPLEAKRFESYLREEKLEHIIEARAELGESAMQGREVYTRNAKSIVLVDSDTKDAAHVDHMVGLPLEIVVDSIVPASQTGSETSTTITASVLFQGQPLGGIRVVAVSEEHPEELIELSTDDRGSVTFQAPTAGAWMMTTLHMKRATEIENADWENFWASSTFPIRE